MLANLNDLEQTDYTGQTFIGTVVANNDPEKLERVKVTIPNLYEGTVANLPWVAPKVAKLFGNRTGVGVFSVPDIGTTVYVEFQNGDPHYPFYLGSPVLSRADLPEADANYPNRYGFKDKAGNLFYVDTTPGSNVVQFTHASGTSIRIENNGNITSAAPTWNHTGTVNVTGQINASVDVVGGGISLKTHTHGGVDTGGGSTAPPNP